MSQGDMFQLDERLGRDVDVLFCRRRHRHALSRTLRRRRRLCGRRDVAVVDVALREFGGAAANVERSSGVARQ